MAVERVFPDAERFERAVYVDYLRRPDAILLVAEVDGVVVGAIAGELETDGGGVSTLGVLPEARGRGIGRALLTALLERFAATGVGRVTLGVRVDNPVAIGLYRSLGFVEGRRLPGYYVSDGMDALEMIRALPGR
jgi:[ribosomal protein S18]-alanine N-acetyltransferase